MMKDVEQDNEIRQNSAENHLQKSQSFPPNRAGQAGQKAVNSARQEVWKTSLAQLIGILAVWYQHLSLLATGFRGSNRKISGV